MKWEDVGKMDRADIFAEMEAIAINAEENAEAHGPSESYSWLRYAEAVRAAIQKLKEV
jgi:hypothetical protein